jgi:DnaJ-class molecular chaperone
MQLDAQYKELNLKKGASLPEIKAAYRRMAKAYHPDANVQGAGDSLKFSRAHDAYQALLKEVMGALRDEPISRAGAGRPGASARLYPFVFNGQRTVGLDVHYDILLVKPALGEEIRLRIPLVRREACPRCLGQGVTLERQGNGFVYKPHACSRCGGEGSVASKASVDLILDSSKLAVGKARIPRAGAYRPQEGLRGDLIVNLSFVDRLPADN